MRFVEGWTLFVCSQKRAKLKEKKEPNAENGLDPFADDDDDVRRIAMQFEEKYGGTGANKKKRKGRKDDYADIGTLILGFVGFGAPQTFLTLCCVCQLSN